MKKNYYQILGLDKGATLDEIKSAYRKYAAKFHPDKHGDDEFFKERFQEIQEAYEYLLEHYKDIDDETENNEDEYRLTSGNIILFECFPKEVQVGDTITIRWKVNHPCNCLLEMDNGYSTWNDEDIPIYGEKHIKVNRINEKIEIRLRMHNNCSEASKSITIYMKKENYSASVKDSTSKDITLWIIILMVFAFTCVCVLLSYNSNKNNNINSNSNLIEEAIIKLEKCQYYDDYVNFINEYYGNNDAAIKQLVNAAYTKKRKITVEVFDIKYFRYKTSYYDASKISSLVLYIDNQQQTIKIFDKNKGKEIMNLEYVYFEQSSKGEYNYYYYGQGLNKVSITTRASYSYNGTAYYRIELGEKIYLANAKYYIE